MTRIIVLIDPFAPMIYTLDDPRPRRELVAAINTGEFTPGENAFRFKDGERQWAIGQAPLNVVVVSLNPPPIRLTRRHYQVLFGLQDGLRAAQIAAKLGISRRTVYLYIQEIKERFGAQSILQVVALSEENGMI